VRSQIDSADQVIVGVLPHPIGDGTAIPRHGSHDKSASTPCPQEGVLSIVATALRKHGIAPLLLVQGNL
jgi:hypothetical protein